MQTRLTSVDRGRCGWWLVGDGLSAALSGIEVAASVAAPDPSLVERAPADRWTAFAAHRVRRRSAGGCRDRHSA